MWPFADLRFADYMFLAICGFAICGPSYFCVLKTSANPQIHNLYPYKYKLKSAHSNSRTTFGTVLRHSDMVFCTCFSPANLQICDLRNGTFQRFADLRFAD
jgi:hypothetical protein